MRIHCILLLALWTASLPASDNSPAPPSEKKPKKALGDRDISKAPPGAPSGPMPMVVECTDGSVMRLQVKDRELELTTIHGKLRIPIWEVNKIEMATRVPEPVAKEVEKAIQNLGSKSFKVREAATAKLFALEEKAYHALVKATRHADREIGRRAKELVKKLENLLTDERLAFRKHDIVHTRRSKVVGQLATVTVRVISPQFGEQSLQINQILSMRSGLFVAKREPKNVIPDPGSMTRYNNAIGTSYYIRVTGKASGSVWGSDIYTTDSTIAVAAVHTGAIKVGETAILKVTVQASPPGFTGTKKNGIQTGSWGRYTAAYTIARFK